MYSIRRKQLQLSQVLFLLSGAFPCTPYQLTTSAGLNKPLSSQPGEDFGSIVGAEEATVETRGLEEPLTAAHESEPTGQTTAHMNVAWHAAVTSDLKAPTLTESPPSPATNRGVERGIDVAPEPQETAAPASPAPPITPVSPGEAAHIEGEFPEDLFSIEDRRRGWVILHVIGMMYMFISLVIVCDEFFVPALGVITKKLAVSDDVAGATFMAAGRSVPKLIGLFIGICVKHITVGIGSIVGSAVFNILFVTGMCALLSREMLHLTWWPLFRDVSFYIISLILLITFFLDNVIMWWESTMLATGYILYGVFMKHNVQLEQAFMALFHKDKIKVIALEEPEKHGVTSGENEPGASEDAERGQVDTDKDSKKPCEHDETVVRANDKHDKPLSLRWPDTRCKQATYLFLLPIILPLWLTLPDVRNQKSSKHFAVAFLGSILWIAVFSYFAVWWAHQVDETTGISVGIMTILAACMSNPDLITSVIVARKGLGDMAVSSSVGSNIFDITVGLPVPWLLYSAIYGLNPVAVNSNGLFCAIVLLFIMLLFAVIVIASFKWRMHKALGFTMFLLYFIFVVLSVMMEYRIIVCPVSI